MADQRAEMGVLSGNTTARLCRVLKLSDDDGAAEPATFTPNAAVVRSVRALEGVFAQAVPSGGVAQGSDVGGRGGRPAASRALGAESCDIKSPALRKARASRNASVPHIKERLFRIEAGRADIVLVYHPQVLVS